MSEPVPLHLSVFYSTFVLSVEHYKLKFLNITHSLPLETTKHNKKQYIKNYSNLFTQVVFLLPIIPHSYYLLHDGLLSQE